MRYYESVFVILAVMGGFLYTLDTPIIVMPIVLFIGKEEAALLLAEARQRVKIA